MSYQPGIPTGSIPLNQDYLNIQNNFTQLNTQFGVDHVPLASTSGTPPNGYHKSIHLIPVSTTSSNPPNNQPVNGFTATAGYGQTFNATINDGNNTDQALYFLTGANRLIQLTRNYVPVSNTRGCTYLPGGIMLQWGFVDGTNGGTATTFAPGDTGNVTFSSSTPNNIAFPNNIWFVNTSAAYKITNVPSSTNSGTFAVRQDIAKTGFNWVYTGSTSSYTRFYWWALGT